MARQEQKPSWKLPREHFLATRGGSRPALASSSAGYHDFVCPETSSTSNHGGRRYNTASASRPPSAFAILPDTTTLAAADFDIDVRSGFLPPQEPMKRLHGPESVWEDLLDAARSLPLRIGGGGPSTTPAERSSARAWRKSIRELPVIMPSARSRGNVRWVRRAHLVLSFLAHFYLHSQPRPSGAIASSPSPPASRLTADEQEEAADLLGTYLDSVPASLARPWLLLSEQLGLPPILTYATTCLWNWEFIDARRGFSLDNIKVRTTFTGTRSEEHFYLTSILIEVRGVEALQLMRKTLDEVFLGDTLARHRIAGHLRRLADVIRDLERLLRDVRAGCDPLTFYWGIRPWFRGGDSASDGKGWVYNGEDASDDQRLLLTGPSAGQSSLVHALDLFLDVDHSRSKMRGTRHAHTSQTSSGKLKPDSTFMQRMQQYMPAYHRAFLSHMAESFGPDPHAMDIGSDAAPVSANPLRYMAEQSALSDDDQLASAYDEALLALKSMRDEHMRIATLYIISQSRQTPPPQYATLPADFVGRALPHQQEKIETLAEQGPTEGPKGTGGTNLVSFLRDCRTNTLDAMLSAKGAT